MGYHIYNWSVNVVPIVSYILPWLDTRTVTHQTDRYLFRYRIVVCTLDRLLAIACWAYGFNPTILFEGVNHLGLVTLESSHSKMRITAS